MREESQGSLVGVGWWCSIP